MKVLLLATVLTLVALAAVAPTASAGPLCQFFEEPPVGQNTWNYACGRAECVVDGLPNILVTCL